MSEDDECLAEDGGAKDQDEIDRIADAYELAVEALHHVAEAMRLEEARLLDEERRREELGAAKAELRALRAARMGIVEARKQLQLAVGKAEVRLRGFEREWFEPDET
jgi:hypothetical protein